MNLEKFVTGKSQIAGVIGNPVSHTLSPFIHNTLSRETGTGLVYIPLHIADAASLGYIVRSLKMIGAIGFNVTVPYKTDIISVIDGMDERARAVGAVNTVSIRGNGFYGGNTDINGFLRGYAKDMGENLYRKQVAVIGAGGTARSVAYAAAMSEASSIAVINRTPAHAEHIVDSIAVLFPNTAVAAFILNSGDTAAFLKGCDVIINTTPVGMAPGSDTCPLPSDFVPEVRQVFYDVIYKPAATLFLKGAAARGCKTANGLSMLLYQAVESFEIWTGMMIREKLIDRIRSALDKVLKEGGETE